MGPTLFGVGLLSDPSVCFPSAAIQTPCSLHSSTQSLAHGDKQHAVQVLDRVQVLERRTFAASHLTVFSSLTVSEPSLHVPCACAADASQPAPLHSRASPRCEVTEGTPRARGMWGVCTNGVWQGGHNNAGVSGLVLQGGL